MTERKRDERRARLARLTDKLDACGIVGSVDILAELEASEQDREALAEAREFLQSLLNESSDFGFDFCDAVTAFLKRTEPDR